MIDAQMTTMIREQAERMEQDGRLTDEVLEYIYDKGLFKLFVPAELDGNMKDLPAALKIFEEAAFADGSFGWLVQIGSGAGFFATTMAPDQVRKYFTARNFYIAGSDRPTGIAKKTDGGYMVNGTWPFSSGAAHASLFTATCKIESEDADNGKLYAFAFTPEQVEIEADWNAFGMKATSSHTIHVTNAFLPAERRFDVTDPHFHFDHPVYHYPFLSFATANIASTIIGVAGHFFEAARVHIESKKAAWTTKGSKRYEYVNKILDENEAAFLKARRAFHQKVKKSWNRHQKGVSLDIEDTEIISKESKIVAHVAISGAQHLYRYLGMDVVIKNSALNRIYRDLHTASQHRLLVDTEGEFKMDEYS